MCYLLIMLDSHHLVSINIIYLACHVNITFTLFMHRTFILAYQIALIVFAITFLTYFLFILAVYRGHVA